MINQKQFKDGTVVFFQGQVLYAVRGDIDPESMMQVTFNRSSQKKSIPLIVNRVEREFQNMKRRAEFDGRAFLFSLNRLSEIEMQFSELVQNAILHDTHHSRSMVSVNIICFPEAFLLLGITDSLGPIKLTSWKLDVDETEDIYMGTNHRGLFIATLSGNRVLYIDQATDPQKELILLAEPDLQRNPRRSL